MQIQKVFFSFIVFFCCSANISSAITVKDIPNPKHMQLYGKEIRVGQKSTITVHTELRKNYKSAVESFEKSLAYLTNIEDNKPVFIHVLTQQIKESLPHNIISLLAKSESYLIEIKNNGIRIIGSDNLGALHGMATLEKILIDNKGILPQGQIIDWPDHKIRALHLTIADGLRPDNIKDFIIKARFDHYNTLILLLKDAIEFDSAKGITRKKAPWTKKELADVVQFARENGLEVVPEISLLTQQQRFLKNTYPHLMYNKSTYDPGKEETYQLVFSIIDELVNLIHPKALHIGHDEVAGFNSDSRAKWLGKSESVLPPELFLHDVKRLYTYLKDKGIETWMWGDMLLAPHEFPEMEQHHLHGINGYASLRNKIPAEVVICDWHYFGKTTEFLSSLAFAMAGHRVLGATYINENIIRSFSRYVARMPKGGEGMIATVWAYVIRDKDLAIRVINKSAEAFWNAR